MGGKGKTTLAKALCAKLCSQFEGYCFLENIREESIRIVVRHRLFSALLEEENLRLDAPYVETPSIMKRLARKKVFVVLDDVAASEQIENLFINNNCLGPGSRVIVTTRDKQICSKFDECEIYEVKELKEHDSLQLFCLNAFKEKHPKNGYKKLSECVIGYCKGNPLALKVLGANLCSKSKDAWKSELKKLQKIPNGKIHSVLKLSYDDLDCTQKDIFLDIACISFDAEWYRHRDRLTRLLEACNFFAASGIEVLLEKALITISQYGDRIKMHDLIKEMGREIVNQESKDPGKRSRLWKVEEVYDVLKNNKGTEDVEAITLSLREAHGDLYLSSDSFKRMTNLRYLEIYFPVVETMGEKIYKVRLPDGLGWLSDKLRYLQWVGFPLESLPSTFCAEVLVELHMEYSKLKKLWDGVQNVFNLKIIVLDGSTDLIEVPDLSRATNLEILFLRECVSLRELHPSILSLPKLTYVDLEGCKKIESLKSNIHSKSLQKLFLKDCSSLTEFSMTPEEMRALYLSGCEKLNIVGMELSNCPWLRSLTELDLSGCTQINASNLRSILDGLRSLYWLSLRGCCNLEALPDNIQNYLMLEYLELDDCRKLVFSLTELPPSLRTLRAANCTNLDKGSTQCPVLENVLQTMLEEVYDHKEYLDDFLYLPGGQVPGEFDFHITTGAASITIPPIPKSDDLRGFIFCIILSEGLDFTNRVPHCFVDEHDKEGRGLSTQRGIYEGYRGAFISDHVLLFSYYYNKGKSGSDHYNLSFKFAFSVHEEEGDEEEIEWSTEGIKGCGVLPVYALERGSELDGSSEEGSDESEESSAQVSDESEEASTQASDIESDGSASADQFVELESSASADQVFDIGESQPTAIRGHEEVGGSINENEHDQQQPSYSLKEEEEDDLNEKSSCNCSIGLLLQHLLGGSNSKQ